MVHEHDHGCGCGHHHDEDTEHLHTNKYQQAFAKFETADTTEEVAERVTARKTWERQLHSRRFKTDSRFHRPDFSHQYRHERKYLEAGRQSERFRRNPSRPTQRCRHLYLSPIRGNGKRGPLRTGGKDCIRSRRFPLLADLHGNKDCRDSDGRHAGGR